MINTLRKIPINLRLTSLVFFFSIGLFLVVYMALTVNKQSLLDQKYAQTKHVVETATGVFSHFYKLEQSGELSRADAQRYAMETIKDTRYSKSEYFWINDYNAVVVMHSVKPALDGKDLSNLADPNGKKLFSEFVRVVKAQDAGFVDYLWPKPGSENPVEKISYVQGFKPWGWILGSGVYLDDVDTQFQQEAIRLGIISAIIILITLLISFVIVRSILLPIRQIQNALGNIADGEGDLTARLPKSGNDQLTQIATSYNTFVERLSQTLTKAVSLNKEVEEKSLELKSVASKTQAITQQREGMFTQMADTIREVDSFKDEVIESTQSTITSAQTTVDKTKTGQDSIQQTVQSLDKLSNELDAGLKTVVQLAEQSQTIGSVLDVISAIAEQTNLLALNAAIEAARAGEQGRGFAVVADEVRGLASRTQASTDEIQAMISKLQSGAKEAEIRITESHQQSKKTTEEIALTTQYLQEIAASVDDINKASNTVIQSVTMQSDMVQKLNHLNEEISELSNQASLQVRQNNETSDALARTSHQTQEVMATFKL
ncbi:methyl-accepting chemotaxis protein [Marinomonas transparens]|uniref:Methyl-accepting chemotaxis protein n=1 Tax=Marinomonas transparens TaxID=2795388 RepID=A0A934MYQ6_9GAMM|nr:methyl-accepting chemotaxis protein [Marinomonas transparens]MBJ7536710.1 methyl-accepting chemotaxis protein [Marinomonas transparens]